MTSGDKDVRNTKTWLRLTEFKKFIIWHYQQNYLPGNCEGMCFVFFLRVVMSSQFPLALTVTSALSGELGYVENTNPCWTTDITGFHVCPPLPTDFSTKSPNYHFARAISPWHEDPLQLVNEWEGYFHEEPSQSLSVPLKWRLPAVNSNYHTHCFFYS